MKMLLLKLCCLMLVGTINFGECQGKEFLYNGQFVSRCPKNMIAMETVCRVEYRLKQRSFLQLSKSRFMENDSNISCDFTDYCVKQGLGGYVFTNHTGTNTYCKHPNFNYKTSKALSNGYINVSFCVNKCPLDIILETLNEQDANKYERECVVICRFRAYKSQCQLKFTHLDLNPTIYKWDIQHLMRGNDRAFNLTAYPPLLHLNAYEKGNTTHCDKGELIKDGKCIFIFECETIVEGIICTNKTECSRYEYKTKTTISGDEVNVCYSIFPIVGIIIGCGIGMIICGLLLGITLGNGRSSLHTCYRKLYKKTLQPHHISNGTEWEEDDRLLAHHEADSLTNEHRERNRPVASRTNTLVADNNELPLPI